MSPYDKLPRRSLPVLKSKIGSTRMCTETLCGATYDDANGVSGTLGEDITATLLTDRDYTQCHEEVTV